MGLASLGEGAETSANTDKTSTNQIDCSALATTSCYHRSASMSLTTSSLVTLIGRLAERRVPTSWEGLGPATRRSPQSREPSHRAAVPAFVLVP